MPGEVPRQSLGSGIFWVCDRCGTRRPDEESCYFHHEDDDTNMCQTCYVLDCERLGIDPDYRTITMLPLQSITGSGPPTNTDTVGTNAALNDAFSRYYADARELLEVDEGATVIPLPETPEAPPTASADAGTVCFNCGRADRDVIRSENIAVETSPCVFESQTVDLCESCNSRFNECAGCGMRHRYMNMNQWMGGLRSGDDRPNYCAQCLNTRHMQCYICGNEYSYGEMSVSTWAAANGGADYYRPICDGCFDNHDFPECEDCGRAYHNYLEPCPRCYRRGGGRAIINNYSFHPTPVFYATDTEKRIYPNSDTRLHFGWELEVEVPETRDRNEVLGLITAPWLYAKSDSSIHYGFELVSHPMTFDWMKENHEEIANRLKKLIELGCKSHNTSTCGTHFHMSKRAFGSLQLFKVQALIYLNPALTLVVSQRARDRLDHYSSLTKEDSRLLARKSRRKTSNMIFNDEHARRVAVNLEPPNTVELRMFRGNLRPDRFFKNLEYCMAAFDYSRDFGIMDMTETAFRQYVKAHTRRFPHLSKFFDEFPQTEVVSPSARNEAEVLNSQVIADTPDVLYGLRRSAVVNVDAQVVAATPDLVIA